MTTAQLEETIPDLPTALSLRSTFRQVLDDEDIMDRSGRGNFAPSCGT